MRLMLVMNTLLSPAGTGFQWLVPGFTNLGFDLILVDPVMLTSLLGTGGAQDVLQAYGRTFRPDLIVAFPPYDAVSHETARLWAQLGIPTLGWRYDDEWHLAERENLPLVVKRCLTNAQSRYALIATTCRAARDYVEAQGYSNVTYLPLACSPPLHAVAAPAVTAGVTFVGSAYTGVTENVTVRQRVLAGLIEAGLPLAIYGKGWQELPDFQAHARGYAPFEQLPAIFAGARINLAVDGWRCQMMKLRLLEIVLAGGFLITEPIAELGEYFEIGKEVIVADDEADLHDKVRYYLDHPAEAAAIAQAGQARAMRDHTLQARWPQLSALIETHLGKPLATKVRPVEEVDRSHADPLFYANLALANLLEGRGNSFGAHHLLMTCARINPDHESVQTGLGRLFEQAGQEAAALAHWQHAAGNRESLGFFYDPGVEHFGTKVLEAGQALDPRANAMSHVSVLAGRTGQIEAYIAATAETARFNPDGVLTACERIGEQHPQVAERILAAIREEAEVSPRFFGRWQSLYQRALAGKGRS